ncbi:uncharacterized protein, partial [Diadema antillarum]|uniref:uncharacterized protein n=1 Tax=Diadema antillarum TaxID=105358 RepID=UPI003A83C865
MTVLGNVLDMTCVNFNPTFDPNQPASFAAIVSGADSTSTLTFQRSIDLTTGSDVASWCSYGDDVSSCQLPSGSNIDSYLTSSAKVTLPVDSNGDNFGAYSCRAERYNWTTTATTLFIRSDAHFTPNIKLTVTASIDEDVRLVMNAVETGTGSLVWMLNGQTDLSASVSTGELYISKASKSMAGVHHYYYNDMPERGGIIRLIVRGCLDNLWGPNCKYTCPTCYNGGICDDNSGRCVCPPGFMGDHCEISCPSGYVGKNCAVSCMDINSANNDCQRALFCLPDPYGCSCAAGWSGLDCSTGCAAGMYGADCTQTCHCASSNQCDPVTGSCDGQGGCDTGWYGPQCQVHIADTVTLNHYAGVSDTANNYIGVYMMEDHSHPSIEHYIGREVDTGPGETGHGVTEDGQEWQDSGLPEGTDIVKYISPLLILRAYFNQQSGGDARAGAFETAVSYKGRREKVVMINEYRGDSNSEVWAEKLSYTIGVGETISLEVQMKIGLNQGDLVWRHNGDDVITAWRGLTSVTLNDVRKSDEGIYECYIDGNRETGKHAIMRLFVRDCPSRKYGLDCSNDCPDCYAGGLCHHVTGECVCRPGFQGGNCGTACSGGTFGANCELDCNCASGVTCNSATGCQGACAAGIAGPAIELAASALLMIPAPMAGQGRTASKDGYDYGTGPVHSYLITYSWTDDVGNTGDSHEPVVISGDSTANITGLYGYRDYEFLLSVRREVEGIATGGMNSSPISAKTQCDAPLYAPSSMSAIITGTSSIAVTWQVRRQMVRGNRRLTFRMMADELGMNQDNVWNILTEDLDMRKICAKMLPEPPASKWLQCDSSSYSYNLTYWPSDNQAEYTVIEFEGTDSIIQHVTGLSPSTEYAFSLVIINSVDLPGPESRINGTTYSIDTQVICTSFSMTVFIDKSLLSDDSANNVHFEDETCGSFDYDPKYVALNTSYDMCRTKMTVTDDKIIYSNVVTYYSAQAINGTDITRDKNLQVSVQCELDRRQLLEENYLTVTGVISYREAGFGNFSLSLARYRDDSFDSPIVDDQSEVELGDPLYFAVELLSVRGLAVFIENCWATPTPYPNSHKRYAFLTDGCEEDPTLEIIDHSDPSFQPFIIEAFTFIKENPEVFIHCQVLVCDNEDPTSRCFQGCQSRDRRSVRQPRGTRSAPHLISNGPLFLRRDGTSHMEDNPQ